MFASKKNILLVLLLLLSGAAWAQVLTPTKLSAALSKSAAKAGEEVELVINARIDTNWHLYATDFDPDLGPTVFTLSFAKSPAYELVGKPKSIGTKKKFDEVFKGDITYFEKTGQIRQRIRLLQPGPLTIRAEAEYQTCTDVDGRCVPGSETLTFGPLDVTGTAVVASAAAAVSSTASGSAGAAGATPVPAAAATPAAAAAPVTAAPGLAAQPADTAATQSLDANAPPAVAAVPAAPAPATTVAAAGPAAAPESGGLWSFGFLAFLSGLAALLTPCVFPMVPMTVSFFTGSSDTRRQGILKALVYGLSIILIYTIIGVIVARLLGEDGPNFMATHWLPNLIFFVVFVVFGLSFLGLFEITLPHALVNKADAQADKGGWLGVFFMAFTLVLVSFSCTGPIVATVLGLAARGQTIMPVVGMLGFSLAFALPFTLFAIFPSWLKSLPRSGGWLNTVKVVLGFIELMLALKFLSMADLAYHWNLLPRDLYIVLWITLSGLLGLYLLGKYKLSHDSDLGHLSVGRLLMAVLAFSFMVYLVPGLFGAPLPLLAGYLPPQSNHDFSLSNANAAQPVRSTLCEAPRYADFLELPHGLQGYFDLEQARRCAKAQRKPIFIDFTGHACVNCRKMEATVWSDPQVLRHLRENYVVVALYVDDKAALPQQEWYTSARDNQQKTTLGKKNADLQVTRYGVNAQPYYVLLDPEEATGKPLVTPLAYEPSVAEFVKFLEAGLREYRQQGNPVTVRALK
ncbi:thiol:disulfide interchange protein DsbD [Hymenobacter daecheongensis DSM 21074]|uniref:Thiol:disulfide interchange protein DsbD n=1 Tax=Hymenobacter daecheongensis DSM 21074 TaxID=1121955 RepID=A0A1M6CQ64_9BACT|nr:cytochrome c biogenesis protein CcdA [Hymenobacter daecheongensis]SHI62868.1 thiol:disulfide interchange protein DsbD [Hymenobacter daecheongensis DSM 21074]